VKKGNPRTYWRQWKKNDKISNEMRCAEVIIEEAVLEVNTNMISMMKPVEVSGDSGKSGGAGLLNDEKEREPTSINGSLDGVILENLDDNVEELAKENLGWRRVEKVPRVCFRFRGSKCVTALCERKRWCFGY
jgi:hypothetical protein